jgi:hypothetical protein
MPRFTTPFQEIAVDLVFADMGESRINRTHNEYMDIGARMGPLKVLLFRINTLLEKLHQADGPPLPQICRFKAGDQRITYEPFPTRISHETLRSALVISGFRKRRCRKNRLSI